MEKIHRPCNERPTQTQNNTMMFNNKKQTTQADNKHIQKTIHQRNETYKIQYTEISK